MSSVLLVSFHLYPDRAVGARRTSELARQLVQAGHRVVAITAAVDAEDGAAAELLERIEGVERIAVPVPRKWLPALLGRWRRRRPAPAEPVSAAANANAPSAADTGGEGPLRRLKRWYHSFEWLVDDKKLWAWRAARKAARLGLGRSFDCVISSGPPMSSHLAVLLARPFLRARWVMDMRDPWTDDSEWLSHVQSRLSVGLDRRFERLCLHRADRVLTTTPGLAENLRRRFPAKASAIEVVYNGYDDAMEGLPAAPTGELRLLYAGSLYYNRDPFPLLQALADLLADPAVERQRVSFQLVGDCGQWQGRALEPWLREHGLADRVQVRPPVNPAAVGQLLGEANVLVNFAQGQPRQIPAKMFEYIASGREMLLLTEPHSDSARLARTAGAGVVVDPADAEQLAQALRELYRRHVSERVGYRPERERIHEFSRSRQNERLLDLVALAGRGQLATEEGRA